MICPPYEYYDMDSNQCLTRDCQNSTFTGLNGECHQVDCYSGSISGGDGQKCKDWCQEYQYFNTSTRLCMSKDCPEYMGPSVSGTTCTMDQYIFDTLPFIKIC